MWPEHEIASDTHFEKRVFRLEKEAENVGEIGFEIVGVILVLSLLWFRCEMMKRKVIDVSM